MQETKKTIRVKTNGVSTGQGVVKLSLAHPKGTDDSLTSDEAETLLCGRRLEVTLRQDDEQLVLAGHEKEEVKALCDCKSYSSRPKSFNATFYFDDHEVTVERLVAFQFTDVEIEMELVGPAGDEEEDDDEFEDVEGQMALDEAEGDDEDDED